MREMQASEVKTHLPKILNEVEQGETIIITRHGRRIARLIPDGEIYRDEKAAAVERLKQFRATMPQVPLSELLTLRHEGHKY